LRQNPRLALPWIHLVSALDPQCDPADNLQDHPSQEIAWTPVYDLLASASDAAHFAVEIDDERRAHLRFGDGRLGRQVEAYTRFTSTYRVGQGPAGNVGAETITHIVFEHPLSGADLRPCNPIPAQGGTAPEPVAQVKLFAPDAFRRELSRAIIPADYAEIVMRDFPHQVQQAAAALRWNGSWYEVLVAIDPLGSETAEPALLDEITGHLYLYRRMGHDLSVQFARYVPLDLELLVCVQPDYLRGHVKAALLEVFSNRKLTDGQSGFFHPDNLTFGEGIFLSKLIAAASSVAGVESVKVKKLERLFEGENGEITNGVLPLSPLEVARLDNDLGFPENGKLTLELRGGR
jgi:predicted phage baseplate assembly protein